MSVGISPCYYIAIENGKKGPPSKKVFASAVLSDRLARDDADLVAGINDKAERIKGLVFELQEARSDNKKLQANLLDIAKRLGDA